LQIYWQKNGDASNNNQYTQQQTLPNKQANKPKERKEKNTKNKTKRRSKTNK